MVNKNLCLLVSVMILGISNIAYTQNVSTSEVSSALEVTAEDENIKANKATYDKAVAAMEDKNFQSAIVYLTVYINAKPKKYEAYKLRGDCYYALRQYNLAEKDYQTAVNLKTADDKLMTGTKYVSAVILGADKNEQLQNAELGNLYARLMYAQKAQGNNEYETSYANAIKYNSHIYLPQPKREDITKINYPQKYGKVVNPQGVDEYIYGAIDSIDNQDYTDAVFKTQYLMTNYPKYYLGYYLNGVALNALEKDDEALVSFNKALEKNPYDFESMASLGNIYFDKAQTTFSQEDARKSIEYFNNALKYNKNCSLYYFYIGMNELQLGNVDSAISNFDSAIKIKYNDYNSLYYKLIAQYIKGDYTQVINGATKLLYKHVSNYNSVLYLRALAEYKMNDFDKASADLDTIIGNFGDIYNADVRVLSPKEQTLENYVYYLKAQIELASGEGAKSDLTNAYKNPIIAQLDKVREAIKPYEKTLEGETLSLEDFNKYNDFYETGLPKILESGAVITEADVDNQYDYLRTTFDDMGLSFVYTNPDYKLTTIKNYPYRKYSSKLSSDDMQKLSSQTSQEVMKDIAKQEKLLPELRPASDVLQTVVSDGETSMAKELSTPKDTIKATGTGELKETTPQEETLIAPNEPSLAKILATNSFGTLGPKTQEEAKTEVKELVKAPEVVKQDVKQIVVDEKAASNDSSGEPFVYTRKPSAVNSENTQSVKKIVEEEKLFDDSSIIYDGMKITAKDIRESREISIRYENPENATEPVETTAEDIKRVVRFQPEPENITKKHAIINPEEFETPNKELPVINPSDEVIVLDKTIKPLYTEEDKIAVEELINTNFNKQNDVMRFDSSLQKSSVNSETSLQKALENVSQLQVEEPSNVSIEVEEPKVTIPETNIEITNKTEEIPVVNVPDVDIPVSDKRVETLGETVQSVTPQLALRPRAEIIEETPIQPEEVQDIISSQSVEIEKERLEIAKIKAVEEEKARKEQIKAQKVKVKELAKAEKEQAKADKLALKAQQKENKAKAKKLAKAEKDKAKELANEEKAKAKELSAVQKEQAKIKKEQAKAQKLTQKEQLASEKAKAKEAAELQRKQFKEEELKVKEAAKLQKEQEKAEFKLKEAQAEVDRVKAKELEIEQKAKTKAALDAEKEQHKIQKAIDTAEKAVRDNKILEDGSSNDLKFPRIFHKSDKTIEPSEVKKTVIKKLEQ